MVVKSIIPLCCCFVAVLPVQLMWERFEQINGTDLIDASNLRVRKLNRTTKALSGNGTLLRDLTEDFTVSIWMNISPLGNNQFYRSPLKVGPMGVCNATRDIWPDYYRYFEKDITNIIRIDECPWRARTLFFNDQILNSSFARPIAPRGFYKAEVFFSNSKQNAMLHFYGNVYNDGYI